MNWFITGRLLDSDVDFLQKNNAALFLRNRRV